MKNYPAGGVYILKIKLEEEKEIKIGALGLQTFTPGYYFYTGTAQTNFEARIKRHYSQSKNFHWHIDYLLAQTNLEKDFSFKLTAAGECFLAQILIKAGGLTPINGFGASDCKCDSHLIYFSLAQGEKVIENLIKNRNLTKEFQTVN
ncbi:GIY-YIG nuclease family protein [Halanaerobium praevalens]|uniref:GIY-YIG domain-containing protein n=1 Tax=Halanaerobium praevalens (strain ATCC 33744 / DSM 2228 / GSL) TaxID=572479 RepID=E3DPF9_HALPG|nr:GIY-YIG nuclease family protein [Halanaerobium praevalens]ADO77721.1 protein of unknown function DUF123 [Halanaerobium praevalens DSM 2228]